ncbi:PIN domain-containing protein [Aquihabitans sp. McL0605]|uniref:PIN domain-containing protein n=1 Tax=Aquihabitans sp. McL0605 TaxID=3415671 RepID=UPI003CE7007F
MRLVLLDTSTLIDVERSSARLVDLLDDDDAPALAAITVAELGVGVSIATGKRKARRQAFLDDLVAALPIIAYDLTVAEAHRSLLVAVRRSGRLRGAHDLIIAATAAATAREVITADRSGFADLPGVAVRSP